MVRTTHRQAGSLMIELVVALSIVTVGLLAFVGSFMSNFRGVNDINDLDEVHMAFENAAETLSRHTFGDIYDDWHGTSIAVPNLEDPGGGVARIVVTCYLDEGNFPAEFGNALTDIDGTPGTNSVVDEDDAMLMPVRLRLTYDSPQGTQVQDLYLVLDPD